VRVLVTGGAGYVGSHTVYQLLEAGHDVWVYDDLSRGHAAAVPDVPFVQGHLSDRAILDATLESERIEAIVHFAAYALVAESVADPALYYRNNVLGSLSLLDAMRATGVGRIVFSSSCATYGHPPVVPIPEDAPQIPVNPYGFTKLVIERALDHYAQAYGMSFVSLRYFNAAGAAHDGSRGEDHDPETHAIPISLQVALGQRDRFMVYGGDYPTPDGTCIRDYIHVDDLADAHVRALSVMEPGRGLFLNLGTGIGHSVLEVLDAARRVTGHAIPAETVERRPGDPAELVADPSQAMRILGWRPQVSELDRIVASAWGWHRHHPRGFDG
jgi:UDP-glucose 4-epimerase